MHFTSPNTNFLTQGGAALDPCPTRGFLRFALNVSPSNQFLKAVISNCSIFQCSKNYGSPTLIT